MNDHQLRLAAYTRQILGASPAIAREAVSELPGAQAETAFGALESVMHDQEMRQGHQFALEAIILPKLRPVAFIQNDTYGDLPDPWAQLSIFKEDLRPVIQAIGRVEVDYAGAPFGGTGWLCGPGLMMTNRHVAEMFTYGVGLGGSPRLRFIPQRSSRLEMGHEHPHAKESGFTYRVIAPLMIHPHWDCALLQVEVMGDPSVAPSPLSLCSTAPEESSLAETNVVVIGYPYWSSYHDENIIKEVFSGVYGVKRIQPGKLMRYESIQSYNRPVDALLHDASTLGGNSGSAVVHLDTQQVLGLHFAGTYLLANYSVPTWELAKDPRFVDAGVNFAPAPPSDQPRKPEDGGPIWLSVWKGRDGVAPANPIVTPIVGVEALPATKSSLLDPGWYERYSDEELKRLYQRDPEQFRALLAATMPPDEAQHIFDTVLRDASLEGIFAQKVNGDFPEIVLIPGILGSHLDRPGFGGRSWLNPLSLPFSNLLHTLGLDVNGNDPNSLQPDGYLRSYYSDAARAWRNPGFQVHEFSYDWRVPLARSARRLRDFLVERRRSKRNARFVLVCHSMGGLVASIYSRDNPDWRDYVEQSYFCGTPLGGSFAIMQILTGEYAFVRKLAALSLATSLEDLQKMGATFPGALEILPNPALFSKEGLNVERLYRRESYPSMARPSADWLQAARRIKDDFQNAPILGRTSLFVGINRSTAGAFQLKPNEEVFSNEALNIRGDGTVPAVSALVDGLNAYVATFDHSDLLKDPVIIESVPALIQGKRIPLTKVTPALLNQPLVEAPAPSLEAKTLKWETEAVAVRERMRSGITTTEDLRWLLKQD